MPLNQFDNSYEALSIFINQQDEKILTDAERRMNAEFAVALGMDPQEIPGFIQVEREKVS